MKNILVTGGCGFLGHHLVEHLLKNTDANIKVVDRLSYASAGLDRLRDIQAFNDKRVLVLGADLTDRLPSGVIRELGIVDAIIHAAAESHVDRSIEDPVPFIQSNVMGTHHILMLARQLEVPRTLLVSTDEVYGAARSDATHEDFCPTQLIDDLDSELGQNGIYADSEGFCTCGSAGFAPNSPYRPGNPYAATKAAAECLAFAYANTYKIPVHIVNTMNLIGERQGVEKFVPLVIRAVMRGHTVKIHADPTKTVSGTRFYLHCRTFASALLHLLQPHVAPPAKSHVVGEREISNLELAQTIAGIVGKPLKYELVDFHSSRPGHDLRYAMQDTVAHDTGWVRPVSLETSLERTVRWYLDPQNAKWLE